MKGSLGGTSFVKNFNSSRSRKSKNSVGTVQGKMIHTSFDHQVQNLSGSYADKESKIQIQVDDCHPH